MNNNVMQPAADAMLIENLWVLVPPLQPSRTSCRTPEQIPTSTYRQSFGKYLAFFRPI